MKNVGDDRATEIKGFKNRNTVNERHNFTETLRKNKREEMQKLKRSKMTNSQNTNNGTNSTPTNADGTVNVGDPTTMSIKDALEFQ